MDLKLSLQTPSLQKNAHISDKHSPAIPAAKASSIKEPTVSILILLLSIINSITIKISC